MGEKWPKLRKSGGKVAETEENWGKSGGKVAETEEKW